jgi:uncharacterized membrane protein YoaK (UPF0700 family)
MSETLPRLETLERSLWIASILAASGGFLDAFTYIGHGHVFANAMTGNVVLFAVLSTTGRWPQAIEHIPPILAFLCGVAAAETFQLPRVRARFPYPATAALGLEMAFLFVGGWLPSDFPSLPIVLTVSFLAALQSSAFRQAEQWTYNSTMTTGNLRTFGSALFQSRRDPVQARRAMVFGVICLAFLAGATLGGLCTSALLNKALWIVDLLLLTAWIPLFVA